MPSQRPPRSRKPPGHDVAEQDRELFREAVGKIRPLSHQSDTGPGLTRPQPDARQFELDEARVRDELLTHEFDPASIEMGEEIFYLKSGQAQAMLKRLRRGHFSIRAEIDLHQMTVAVARQAVTAFLNDAIDHRELCVRIVHGKGLRSSARGPVVKRMTEQLLRRRDDVLAFASARPAQGGTGAVLVLLRGRQSG